MNLKSDVGRMETSLRAKRDGGGKLLVAYVTGGFEGWETAVEAAAAAGADAIEIGIPFFITFPVLKESINFFRLNDILSKRLFNSFMLANSTSS